MRLGLTGTVVMVLASAVAAAGPPAPVRLAGEPPFDPTPAADGQTAAPTLAPFGIEALPDGPPAGVLGPRYAPVYEGDAYPYFNWARLDYLVWWVKDGPAPPPLVTIGSAADDIPALPGQPGTRTVIGDQIFRYGTFSGVEFTVGSWLDLEEHCGVEFSGFALDQRTTIASISSDMFGNPPIGRPITSAQDRSEQVLYVALPENFAGTAFVSSSSELWGMEANLIGTICPWQAVGKNRWWGGDVRVELRGGFRYLDLEENVNVGQVTNLLALGQASFLNNIVLPPATEVLADRFSTRNQFYGGQLGGKVDYCRGRWTFEFLGELAIGETHQMLDIEGSSNLIVPGFAPVTAAGGLLATSTNSGRQRRDIFGLVPEVGLNVSYALTPQIRAFAGYTFLYWNSVVRPGDQIDTTVNVTQVPVNENFGPLTGPARPAVPFRESDFWAQGISLGVEVRF